MMVEEVKIQVPASQVVKELTNQRFNAITVKSMEIIHMSAERDQNKKIQDQSHKENNQTHPMFMACTVVVPITVEIPNIVSPMECNVSQAGPCDIWYLVLELLHTHLGFIFPKVFPFLLVIISHYPVSYILRENIPPKEYSLQLTLQFD
jgi:hypothetical protein